MKYDYVIVGAGSAGCVLAERLSASGLHRVLLLEAGPPDSSPLIAMPKGFGKLLHDPKHVWSYQAGDGARNRPERWVRGKTLGGSSSVNGMTYTRGDPKEYDAWAANGCPGWGWANIGAAFKALEDHELGDGPWRGSGGPLHISLPREKNAVCDAWIAAGTAAGVPEKQDLNDLDIEGVGYFPRTIKHGVRQSASTAFLRRARNRKNLTVKTGATVKRVSFTGLRATGVVCDVGDVEQVYGVHRDGEIILAAGALNSPQLLQRSGIGPVGVLRRAGVAVLVDAPDVGRNLREHRVIFMQWRLRNPALSHNRELSSLRLLINVFKYAAFKSGALAQGPYEAGGFVKTRPDLARPDAQLLMSPFSLKLGDGDADSVLLEREPGVQCIAYPLRPSSLGYIEIGGDDPHDPARIDANYLDSEGDRSTAISMVRFVRQMFKSKPLSDLVTVETAPGPEFQTDEAILAAFQRFGGCGYHATGTCRMGSDDASVVDPCLRVRGVEGLRVMDCSVMPTLASGNTNGPAMAMAWHAATLILGGAR